MQLVSHMSSTIKIILSIAFITLLNTRFTAQDAQVTLVFDTATDLVSIQRIVSDLGLEKKKKVAIYLAMLSDRQTVSSLYSKGEPMPYNLSVDPGCNFSPCEKLREFIQYESPKLTYIVDDKDGFSCILSGRTYRIRNLSELRNQLELKLKSKKLRLQNSNILIYFEGGFQARKPTVVVSPATIVEGESVTLKATGTPSGGEYFWPDLRIRGQNVNQKPEQDTEYKVLYGIDNCWSDTAVAVVTVTPTPPCVNYAKPSLISVSDHYSDYLEFNADLNEYTFYPDNSTDNYVIQLDSVCAPTFIEFKLIDPSSGKRRDLLEKQDFRVKVNDDRRKVFDDPRVYEITVEKSKFAFNLQERQGKPFITTQLYQMVIYYFFNDGNGGLDVRESDPIDVLFNQCAR